MQRIRIFLILSLFPALVAAPQAEAQNPDQNSLIWRISGNDLQKPSYLFGTLHLICQEDFHEFEGLEPALQQSNMLILELDLEDPMMVFTLMQHILMPADTLLEDLVTTADFQLLASFFTDSLGMDLESSQNIRPLFLMSMIMPALLACPTLSYDLYLAQRAKDLDIPIQGLETLQEQVEVFNLLPIAKQADMLVETIRYRDRHRADFIRMRDHYLQQDLQGILQLVREADTAYEAFQNALLEQRNRRWVPRMEELMQKNSCFFGVGAGHLPGDEGLIQLLINEGYILEPLLQ